MEWHPAQLSWDQQMFVLWVLLPPIFFVCGILAFLAPVLYKEKAARPASAHRVENLSSPLHGMSGDQ
jgi:hypothetical protein